MCDTYHESRVNIPKVIEKVILENRREENRTIPINDRRNGLYNK